MPVIERRVTVAADVEVLAHATTECPEFADETLHEALVWLREHGYLIVRDDADTVTR